jgi:predicted metal-dependent phosphoesterase TrpH
MIAQRAGFAVDFHVHTSYSFDSLTPPKLAIESARRRGLAGIAVTDHDTIDGAIATVEANRHDDFLVIPGIEIKSDLGDIIGLYLSRDVRSRRFADVIAEIHEQGGLAYLPHPLRTFGAMRTAGIFAEFRALDLWELYNGRYDRSEFTQAEAVFAQLGISGPLCGSDAHFPWEIGLFETVLDVLPRDPQTLLAHCNGAKLQASVRGEIARRTGLRLGAVIKAYKRRQYRKLAPMLLTLPWKALRRIITTHA